MNSHHIPLVASFVVVISALVFLLIEINASPDIELPEEALAQAQAQYERHAAARKARPPRTAPVPPARRARAPRAEPAKRPSNGARSTSSARSRPNLSGRDSASRRADQGTIEVGDVGKLYDHGRYDEALELAEEYLRNDPDQRYVRRVAVTSSCALGEATKAREHQAKLPPGDQRVVRTRCARFGIDI